MRSIGVQVLSADLVVLPADHAAQAREVRLRLIGAGVIIDERDRMIDALRGVFVITSDINILPIRLSPTATSGSVRPCSWTFTSLAIFGSHNRSQSSSDFFPTTRPAPPTWRRLAGATGLFAPIVSRGVSANHPSRLRKPENVAERHPSRGQSPAPASLPQRIHLPASTSGSIRSTPSVPCSASRATSPHLTYAELYSGAWQHPTCRGCG